MYKKFEDLLNGQKMENFGGRNRIINGYPN
jgi:hypothetical protein